MLEYAFIAGAAAGAQAQAVADEDYYEGRGQLSHHEAALAAARADQRRRDEYAQMREERMRERLNDFQAAEGPSVEEAEMMLHHARDEELAGQYDDGG